MPDNDSTLELKLFRSEEQFRFLFEHSPIGMALTDYLTGQFLEVNQSLLQSTGYCKEELLGLNFSDITPQEYAAKLLEAKACLSCTGRFEPFQKEYIRKDGSHYPLEVRGFLMRDTDGRQVVWAIIEDITVRKRTEDALQKNEQVFRSIFEQAAVGVAIIESATGRFLRVNKKYAALVGLTIEELLLCSFERITHIDDMQIDWSRLEALKNGRLNEFTLEKRYLHKNGSIVWVMLAVSPLLYTDNQLQQHLLIIHDITEQKLAEARVLESEEKLRGLFELSPLGIALNDMSGRFLEFNQAFEKLCGYSGEELKQLDYWALTPEKFKADEAQQLEALEQKGSYGPYQKQYIHKNGSLIHLELNGLLLNTKEHGKAIWSIVQDITKRKNVEDELNRIAHYDTLTNIPNRVLLADRMHHAIAQAARKHNFMAVCYLDLDGFKPINDMFGHAAGDRVLIEVAQRIQETLRGGDTVARLGGDEFVILLLDLDQGEECVATLVRLLTAIAVPIKIKDKVRTISASIGVSLYPLDNENPDTLLRHADQAMYQAKELGRNRYHIYDHALDRRARDQHAFLESIRYALAHQQFELHYQPKVNLHTRALVGAEALIRWRHPERGLLPPSEFLCFIANSDLDIAIGEWVTATALAQLNEWLNAGLNIEISINISGYHLESGNFVEKLTEQLSLYPDLPFGNFQIEILETVALNDIAIVREIIESCRNIGVSFALDDFGTGYSSLSYLSSLPVDTLKIDQSFVRDMLEDKGDRAIVQGIIALADAFNRQTVGEGIETDAHYRMLLELGCEIGQGYGIARPMPAAALAGWHAAQKG